VSVGWISVIAVGIAGVASMRAAIDQGDLDEAARQGALAGPAVIEQALVAKDRPTRLAAILAAPLADGGFDLLEALSQVAIDPDRRVAIPAARAARAIAYELSRHDIPDDIAVADLAQTRDIWVAIAIDRERPITLRVLALETAAAIDRLVSSGIGVALPAALAAAATLCTDLVVDPAKPILDALGSEGRARLRSLVTIVDGPRITMRDAARCLTADKTPESAAALRKMRVR